MLNLIFVYIIRFLAKFSVFEGNSELALKLMGKLYSLKDLGARQASKNLAKNVFDYDQIEMSSMVKHHVKQGEIIISKLLQRWRL